MIQNALQFTLPAAAAIGLGLITKEAITNDVPAEAFNTMPLVIFTSNLTLYTDDFGNVVMPDNIKLIWSGTIQSKQSGE